MDTALIAAAGELLDVRMHSLDELQRRGHLVTALLANWFNAERTAPTTADPAAADRSEIDDRIPADA